MVRTGQQQQLQLHVCRAHASRAPLCLSARLRGSLFVCQPELACLELVSSEFHLPRACYFFEAVLSAAGLAHVAVLPLPAATPAPSAADRAAGGVNAKTLRQRLLDELRYVTNVDARTPALLRALSDRREYPRSTQ